MSDYPGVHFFAAPGQIETGEYVEVAAHVLIDGWECTGCHHELRFIPARPFGDVFEAALAHEMACAECPKPC